MVDVETNTHYFHWLWDIYKPFDYEPIRVNQVGHNPTVLSRYHWFTLTLWLHPIIMKAKPIVRFVTGFHTAICLSEKAYVHFGELEELSGEESFWFYRVLLPFLKRETSRKTDVKSERLHGYHRKVEFSDPPEIYKFDVSKSKCYFIISREPPLPENLPNEVRKILWPNWSKTGH